MSGETETTAVLMYPGWQVWDSPYGPVRVGDDFTASVEFVQRSPLRVVTATTEPHAELVVDNHYVGIADVLTTDGAVVIDLGGLRALTWVRPDEGPGEFAAGTTVTFELSLNLNPWDHASWTDGAAEHYKTDHRWHVRRIQRRNIDDEAVEYIAEASTDTVDSAHQYCLVECTLVE